jgi:lipopolysaccharide cholinephosphotransferase
MTNIQKYLLKSLIILLEVFDKNGIEYFAIGGTALGALRHNGFIPWDDDIDIGLPRYSYEKLINLIKNDQIKIENYNLICFEIDKNYNYLFVKFIDENIPIVENIFPESIIGLYIDIFPIDGCSNNIKTAKKHIKKINFLSKLFVYKKIKWKNLIGTRKMIKFFSLFIPSSRIYNHIKFLQLKYTYNDSKYVANTVGAWKIKEIQEAEVFKTFSEHKFESLKIKCPSKLDKYLSTLYGNYMILPSKDKQISHHNFIFLKKESEEI